MNEEQQKDLVYYRITKAKDAIAEVENHLQNKYLNTAVNRLYYACFYAVCALLASKGIYTKTHLGTRQMFALHFIKTGIVSKEAGKLYSDIFDIRQTGDYEDFLILDEDEVGALIQPAKEFINTIEQIIGSDKER
jgi:uncharacterized protein (UPF0332 family)